MDSTSVLESYIAAYSLAENDKELLAVISLESYLLFGKLLIASGRLKEAYAAAMSGCKVYSSSALLLLVGITCMRMDRLVDAEDALKEANLLDNRNPEIWAYLSLNCLLLGYTRLEEVIVFHIYKLITYNDSYSLEMKEINDY